MGLPFLSDTLLRSVSCHSQKGIILYHYFLEQLFSYFCMFDAYKNSRFAVDSSGK